MPTFISGIELNRRFYETIVQPLLHDYFPDLPYAAALIGPGSEVLGFDTEMSMDHDWGIRLFLLLREEDADQKEALTTLLSRLLPETFLGIPVSFPVEPIEPRTRTMKRSMDGPILHRILPLSLRDFVRIQLGSDLSQPLQAVDWLTFSSSALLEMVAGAVYHDGIGELTQLRRSLEWYPHDVWLYLLASGWQRIGQEEHLMPRAGFVDDELGSALIGSRLIRDVIRLCFLIEKQYAPYPKWLGTAFKRLRCATVLWPLLWRTQQASTWQEREAALSQAYKVLASMHNQLGITSKIPETVYHFYNRPFLVIGGGLVAQACVEQITDPQVKKIIKRGLIGNVDQWSDNTDIGKLERSRLRQIYE